MEVGDSDQKSVEKEVREGEAALDEKQEKIVKQIRDVIDRETILHWNTETGCYHCEIYADYTDTVDGESIQKWCCATDPMEAFYEDLNSWYEAYFWEYEDDLLKNIEDNWEDEEINFEENKDFIIEWASEHTVFSLPASHYLQQTVCVDIIVDTGDENVDYVLNSVYPHYDGSPEVPVPEKASILWLTRQQGYNKRSLNKALRHCEYGNSKLLKSIYTELLNCSTHMNALVFFVSMTVEELFELQHMIRDSEKNEQEYKNHTERKRKKQPALLLDRNARCGLLDVWSGAGSILDIELEQDVILPLRFISSAWPDGGRGYGAVEIYGLPHSFWTPTVKKIA